MQEIVANVDHITFSIEKMLEQQTGAQALMFPGMDSKCLVYELIFFFWGGGIFVYILAVDHCAVPVEGRL